VAYLEGGVEGRLLQLLELLGALGDRIGVRFVHDGGDEVEEEERAHQLQKHAATARTRAPPTHESTNAVSSADL
jgi:hypothetical protein